VTFGQSGRALTCVHLWQIRKDLAANGIGVYPQKEYDEDPEERVLNDRIRVTCPLRP